MPTAAYNQYQNLANTALKGTPYAGMGMNALTWTPFGKPSTATASTPQTMQYRGLPTYQNPAGQPSFNLNPAFGQATYPGGGNYRGTGVPGNKPVPAVTSLYKLGLLNDQQYNSVLPSTRFGPGGSVQDQYAKIAATLGIPVGNVQSLLWQANTIQPWQGTTRQKGNYVIGPGGNLIPSQPESTTTYTPEYKQAAQGQIGMVNPYYTPDYLGLPNYSGGGGVTAGTASPARDVFGLRRTGGL